ncbi:MAG: nickel-responsive transcriptional regulator NikR [Chthoniobacter sp.]|nr:nickel-responsive transcriptional regulator NikR [Chthoniobacter sp.]
MPRSRRKPNATRISISLPVTLFDELDEMVAKRGYASRSDAISKMISEQLVSHQHELGKGVMAGTITLIYDHAKAGLASRLLSIQHKWLKEVISSQRVHLENHHSLEVLLVQGPGYRLKQIAAELIACKGVKHGYLTVTSTILPPIH